jgi:hypothetical protein
LVEVKAEDASAESSKVENPALSGKNGKVTRATLPFQIENKTNSVILVLISLSLDK